MCERVQKSAEDEGSERAPSAASLFFVRPHLEERVKKRRRENMIAFLSTSIDYRRDFVKVQWGNSQFTKPQGLVN